MESPSDEHASGANVDYCPAVIKHIEQCIPKLHTMTGLLGCPMRCPKDVDNLEHCFDYRHWPRHFTNNPVEGWHKTVKQDILGGRLKLTPTCFIQLLKEVTEVKFHSFVLGSYLSNRIPITCRCL